MKQTALTNVVSERVVLAGLCQYGKDAYIDVEFLVDEQCFTTDYNKIIFRCLKHVLSTKDTVNYTDILSAAKALNLDDFFTKPQIIEHLKSIYNIGTTTSDVYEHAKVIRKLAVARELKSKMKESISNLSTVNGYETLTEIIARAEEPVQEILLKYSKEEDMVPKVLGDFIDEHLEFLKENDGKPLGISTGFPLYDRAIGGGLRRKCVDLIAARPKQGKSMLADNIALNVLKKYNIPVLMLDTEMSKEDHINRILSRMSDIDLGDLSSGAFIKKPGLYDNVKSYAEELKSLPYHYMSVAGMSFEDILVIVKRWIHKHVGFSGGETNPCLVIYDYLKLMSSDNLVNNLAEFQVLGFQITALHNFCVKYDIPCLAFVQLNRDGINRESTDVVSGSDRLIWLCTSFSIFKSKSPEEVAADGPAAGNKKLIPIVARHGPGIEDNGYICMRMTNTAKIDELGYIRQLVNQDTNDDDEDTEAEEDTMAEETVDFA